MLIGLFAIAATGCDVATATTTISTSTTNASSLITTPQSSITTTTSQPSSTTTTSEPSATTTTTTFVDPLGLPFAKPIHPIPAILAKLASMGSERVLYLANDLFIYYVPTTNVMNDNAYVVVLSPTGETIYRTGSFETFLGFDAIHSVLYFIRNEEVKHLGTVDSETEWKFSTSMVFANPYFFANGSQVFDYFGNNLAIDTDNRSRIIYPTGIAEEVIYHTYNHKRVGNVTCTVSSYRLGEATPFKHNRSKTGFSAATSNSRMINSPFSKSIKA
ncbi:MAG: hypothetical protein MZU97_06060 [Bacillus subtilis]|nr:hypothetical protein [Bacillus subtilis]